MKTFSESIFIGNSTLEIPENSGYFNRERRGAWSPIVLLHGALALFCHRACSPERSVRGKARSPGARCVKIFGFLDVYKSFLSSITLWAKIFRKYSRHFQPRVPSKNIKFRRHLDWKQICGTFPLIALLCGRTKINHSDSRWRKQLSQLSFRSAQIAVWFLFCFVLHPPKELYLVFNNHYIRIYTRVYNNL